MKIAFIRQRYNPFGGAERFVERATAELAAQGATITIIARDWAGATHQRTTHAPSLVRCDPFHIGRWWRDASFARAVCALVGRDQYDLVQSHERLSCCDIYRAGDGVHRQWLDHRARQQSAPARWFTALNPYHRYVLAAEARLFASTQLRAVVCNSRMVQQDITRHFPAVAKKLHVIYNGLDLETFHPRLRTQLRAAERARLGIAADQFVYVFVGAGFERKGVNRLLEAFARQPGGTARLLVVGNDRALAATRRRAQASGIGARVHFAGGQPDVRPYYAAADCFVLPTLYDPMPNAAIEALACGLPVITSLQSGAAELITEGSNGFVGDALDPDGLADRMTRVRALDPLVSAIAARSAVAELSIERMTERLLALYRGLLAPAGRMHATRG